MSRSIEKQALRLVLIPIFLLAMLLESYFMYTRFANLDRMLFERAQSITRQLASSSEYAVFSGNTLLLKQEVDAALSQPDVSAVMVLDAAGNPFEGLDRQPLRDGAWHARVGRDNPVYQDGAVLMLFEPIVATQIDLDELDGRLEIAPAESKPLGAIVVEISKQRMNREKNQAWLFNLLPTMLLLMATAVMALRSARKITRPVMEMSRVVRKLGAGEMDARISLQPGIDELSELAGGINQMAQQLQTERDMLQRRIAEATDKLRQKKEEAENANHDKSRFLAAASHDLRQPMHALGLFVGQLHSKVTTPEQVKIAQKIEESVNAMSNLLNGLLDISKLDAGVVKPEVCVFSIGPLLERLVQDYAQVAEKKHITLRVVPACAEVRSDPLLLERILLNLLNNALRYTPQHGRVLLACRKRGNYLRIEVRDNGAGIPAGQQQNIFREFFQLENAARDRDQGLGLGLAIVKRLSGLLDHPVSLCSEPGRGSVFSVEVPLALYGTDLAPAGKEGFFAQKAQELAAETGMLDGVEVLLVDDDALVRAGASGMLAAWGCKVHAAASLTEVRDRFAAQDFDLLICDYRLPDGTWLEVIAWVEQARGKHSPAILISGDVAPAILQQAVAQGVYLLHKPVRPAKLHSLMLFLLSRQG